MLESKDDGFVNDQAAPYQLLEKENGQENADRIPQNRAAKWKPLSFPISMYSLPNWMFIECLNVLSGCIFERELRQRLDAQSFPGAALEVYSSTPTMAEVCKA